MPSKNIVKNVVKLTLSLFYLLILVACHGAQQSTISLTNNLIVHELYPPVPAQPVGWKIGFDRRLEPKDDLRQIASLAVWLTRQTGLPISVHVTTTDSRTVIDDLCDGHVDFAAVGTVSYLQAHDLCGVRILARGRNSEGNDTYRAAIVVPADSPLQSVTELYQHTFVFGAPNSTQGYLIPRLMLQQAGITLDDLRAYNFSGSHTATANAVVSGRYEAGALQDTLARELAQRGLIRVLAYSESYPSSGIVAGPGVPEKTITIIQQALLTLEPAGRDVSALYQWERSEMPLGFALASDEDYDTLRHVAQDIGLLKP